MKRFKLKNLLTLALFVLFKHMLIVDKMGVNEMKELNLSDLFSEELVFVDFEASSNFDVLNKLYQKVLEKGYVKESYIDGVWGREQVYPTGLETAHIKVAIPHTDAIHVNKSCITIAKLKDTVKFKNMATGVDDVDVGIVFMLAVHEPKDQIKVLQKVIGIFSKEEIMKKISEAKTSKELLDIVFEGAK